MHAWLHCPAGSGLDDPGQTEELGADLESGLVCRLDVDLEADLALLQVEIGHPALVGKSVRVAHGQHGSALDIGQNLRETGFL